MIRSIVKTGVIIIVAGFGWYGYQYILRCMPYFTLPQRMGRERRALELKVPGSGAPDKLDAQGRLRVTAGLAVSLSDPDVDVRRGAARRLQWMADFPDAKAAQALPALERAVSDPDREVGWESCRAILRQSPNYPSCFGKVVNR